MGDLSNEPSMEEILSSIKRIIAEEGDTAPRVRRAGRAAPIAESGDAEVLELSDPILAERSPAGRGADARPLAVGSGALERPRAPRAAAPSRDGGDDGERVEPAPRPEPVAPATRAAERPPVEPAVSPGTVEATRGALDHLSRMLVRPEPGSDGTLESLVREMIRPMLRDWLDAHLPALVHDMVQREIGRITGSQR